VIDFYNELIFIVLVKLRFTVDLSDCVEIMAENLSAMERFYTSFKLRQNLFENQYHKILIVSLWIHFVAGNCVALTFLTISVVTGLKLLPKFVRT